MNLYFDIRNIKIIINLCLSCILFNIMNNFLHYAQITYLCQKEKKKEKNKLAINR